MLEKIFGKKKSIQRSLIISFTIATCIVIIFSLIGFYVFVDNQAIEKIIEISVRGSSESVELQGIIRRSIFVIIINTILIGAAIIRISIKKMLQPITMLNEATKKVAQGNFNVKLETTRKDEIGELVSNFNKMTYDLGKNEEMQKEFIDNVSHEIKTPIASIQGFSELLSREDLTPEERNEYSQVIKDESNRLLSLSTNMLKLSQLQNQSKIINKEEINVTEQIRKAIKLLEPKWNSKNIIFKVSLEEKFFFGEEELMFQVWVNLIDNAIKFSKQDGEIDIALIEKNNLLEIEITDNGIGIDNEEINKIFNRFYQIDESHSNQGYGLGLAIVKRIIELSNGKIEIKSKVNIGTTVKVILPVEDNTNKILTK